MFNHNHKDKVNPKRIVILGAQGFVGQALVKRLSKEKVNYIALGRQEIDLTYQDATQKLLSLLEPHDALVIISAKAPCKNYSQLLENIQMMKHICDAITQKPVAHVTYISSDAVYADSKNKLTESSPAAPTSLHGVMHLAREQMLASIVPATSLAILRPTLLYGKNDPHNGYGPNSFYRLAIANKEIPLFGKGEEQRDHVYIEDVAEIIYQTLMHHSHGILNITTGNVVSFFEVAEEVIRIVNKPISIQFKARSGPMPHNGYRAFDISLRSQMFPHVQFKSLREGLKLIHTSQAE